MNYPIWDISIGGGMLMAVVAVTHVIVSHFAVGGGLVIAVTETLSVRRNDWEMRELARRASLTLILISTVYGAISGVGIWVVAGLISPGAISALIHTYVWGWAIEWVFFIVEIVAALVYFSTWGKISKWAHLMVGWVYFVAAYMSLVVINGIITFMLTPGRWLETGAFWDGFFNPTYWPSVVLRTGITLVMASVFMVISTHWSAPERRAQIVRYLGLWFTGGVLLSYVGYRWWEARLPDSIRGLFLGASPALASLADTRHLVLWAMLASLILAVILLFVFARRAVIVAAAVLMLTSFTFFAAYERLREGVRKPFLIHSHMFSNGLLIDDVSRINDSGFLAVSGWSAHVASEDPVSVGRAIFKAQCASCHTIDGYQAIRPLLPDDPDMIFGVLAAMWEMGEGYAEANPTEMINTAEFDYAFMPPFVGNDEELEALALYLTSLTSSPDQSTTVMGGGQ